MVPEASPQGGREAGPAKDITGSDPVDPLMTLVTHWEPIFRRRLCGRLFGAHFIFCEWYDGSELDHQRDDYIT
jgi:hypothetical protein